MIVIPTKTAEADLLCLGQEADCSWAKEKIVGNRALLLDSSKAPATSKLLHMSFLSQDSFFRSGTQPKIKEVSSPSFLIPRTEGDDVWKGFLHSLSAPKLERSAAREIFKDDSLYYISAVLLKEEYSTRCHLVDLISASSAAEAASCKQENIKAIMAPIIKYLS